MNSTSRAVLDGRPGVTAHADRIGSDLARYNILSQGQACQDESVETLDEARGEVRRFPLNRGIEDGVAGEERVVHFLSEVLLGLGQLQLPIDPLSYLLLCKRVPFDGCGCVDSTRESEGVQLIGRFLVERNPGDMLALGPDFPQSHPERGGRSPEIEGERQPRMCPLVCPHIEDYIDF